MRTLSVGLLVAGVVLAVYALFFRSNDEDEIHARLDGLAAAVRIDDRELDPRVRQKRIYEVFQKSFTEDAIANVEELPGPLRGRTELMAAAIQAGGVYESAGVSFSDVHIVVDKPGRGAEVGTTATIAGARNGQAFRRDERNVGLQLAKVDGSWRFVAITVSRKEGSTGDAEGGE